MELTKRPSGKIDLHLHSTEDRVHAYMIGKISRDELHKNDHDMMERWISIWHLQLDFKSSGMAVMQHVRLCQERGKPISTRCAWEDLKRANKVFGNLSSTSQRANWVLLWEYQMKVLIMAKEYGDLQEMNRAIKNLAAINENLVDETNQLQVPVIMLNINVPDEGQKTVSLDDLKDLPEAEVVSIASELHDEHMNDQELKNLLEVK